MGLTTIRNVLNLIILCHIPVTTIDAFSTDVVPPTANFDRRIIRRRTKKAVATKVTTQTNTFVLFSSTTTDETVVSSYTSSPSSTKFSTAAEWHRDRRKEMIDK